MTQSDSPDFDFDISDLEVEGGEDPPSKSGEAVSADKATGTSPEKLDVSDAQERRKPESRIGDPGDDALEVFQIDDLPDAPASSVEEEPEAISEGGNVAGDGDSGSLADDSALGSVSRIADAPLPVSARALGDDDLGADVFAEIETDSGGLGLADVIDDLMDEVEEFEAGGFVELGEDEASGVRGDGEQDFLKMEDPDDSLAQSVDPNAEEDEAEAVGPAFPSPPADFEIPIDPEPDSREEEPVAARSEAEAETVPEETSETHDPLEPGPALAEVEARADPTSEPVSPEPPVGPASETVVPEPSESLSDEGSVDSSDGREKVFFDAADKPAEETSSAGEEIPAAASEDGLAEEADEAAGLEDSESLGEEEDLSDLISSLEEDGSAETQESAAEPETPEPVDVPAAGEAMPEELEAEPVPEDQLSGTEDEEDLSGLIASIEDSGADEAVGQEAQSEGPDEELPESLEPGSEEQSDSESSPEVKDGPAEPQAGPVPSEVADEEEDLSSLVSALSEENEELEQEDLSGLVAAASSEGEAGTETEAIEAEEPIEDAPVAAESAETEVVPTAEDLLKQAGSLLNDSKEKPVDGASSLLDSIDEDEEIVAMPSPDAMIAQAAEGEDDEVISLPDPASMLSGLSAAEEAPDDDDEEDATEKPASGNVADRAGDLPPPPPAPVEILDEEPPEEDFEISEPVEAPVEAGTPVEDEVSADSLSSESAASELDETLGALDGFEEDDEGPDLSLSDEIAPAPEAAMESLVPAVVEMPKPSLLWRVTHSMSIAAGLVLMGAASIMGVWRQEILEYYQGRDLDGSELIQEIETIGTHALGKFDEMGRYTMQWVDSEIRRVSENEIRLYGLVGAQLKENLYRPVLESELDSDLGYSDAQLGEALEVARSHFPDEIGNAPGKPWSRLYEISARKSEVLPLRVTYALTRASKDADWELSRVKVSGNKGDIVWPEGEPEHSFGENAYDINSLEFAEVLSQHQSASREYMARIDRLNTQVEDGRLALKQENERQRERVRMAFSEGTYFSGLAILGEDASASRDVNLVITEVRDEGAFVKGVVSMKNDDKERTKYFVGSLEFETTLTGREQGFLSLKTVSIHAPGAVTADSPFFEADNVSRMRLKSDGFRLEGDSRDLSFRMTRSL